MIMLTHRFIYYTCTPQGVHVFSNLLCTQTIFRRNVGYRSNKYYSTKPVQYEVPLEKIRNFSIIAHVDHGKSTLADRLLEMTGAIRVNTGKQVLDTLQVEKERGITVKAQTASLNYTYKESQYLLNLIDTPGHVDFCAEVHRSLAPCQGVILVVDANDGVQAQTVANYHLAKERKLIVIPVINKIDLKNANPDRVVKQLNTLFNIPETDILKISAKMGIGVTEVLNSVVERIPPPDGLKNNPMRALIFDSWFDKYKGAISLIYVKDGSLSVNQNVTFMHTKKNYEVKTLYLLRPEAENVTQLHTGQIGCMTCSMKSSNEANVGDTIHLKNDNSLSPLIGFKPPKPMVFSGVYPVNQGDYPQLRSAIDKLVLNDSSVTLTFESSIALGRGWRVGFLGLLHMEVFIQRLQQEYDAEPIVTMPSVTYKAKIFGAKNIKKNNGDEIYFNNPLHMPERQIVTEFYEPLVRGTIIVTGEFLQPVMSLCNEKRGEELDRKEIGNDRFLCQYLLPLNEILTDFHDELKRISSGYASFDYEEHGYEPSKIVRLEVLLNGTSIDEFSTIVHTTKATEIAKKLCGKLKDTLPRQLFEIAIQVVTGTKVLARENLKAFRKDVTAKLYGGDVTRRKKLLAQQADGKKKMRTYGKIQIPQETFIKILKR